MAWQGADTRSQVRWVRWNGEEPWFFVLCDLYVESKWYMGLKLCSVIILFEQINHIFYMDRIVLKIHEIEAKDKSHGSAALSFENLSCPLQHFPKTNVEEALQRCQWWIVLLRLRSHDKETQVGENEFWLYIFSRLIHVYSRLMVYWFNLSAHPVLEQWFFFK